MAAEALIEREEERGQPRICYIIFSQKKETNIEDMVTVFNQIGKKGYVLVSSTPFNEMIQHLFLFSE